MVELGFSKNQLTWGFNTSWPESPKTGDRKLGENYYIFTFKISRIVCSVKMVRFRR